MLPTFLFVGFLIFVLHFDYFLLEVGGQFVKPPTGKSFRFVRACERARDQRFDCAARAVVRPFPFSASPVAKPCPAGCPRKILF